MAEYSIQINPFNTYNNNNKHVVCNPSNHGSTHLFSHAENWSRSCSFSSILCYLNNTLQIDYFRKTCQHHTFTNLQEIVQSLQNGNLFVF